MKRLIVTGSRDVSYGLYMSLFLDLSGWLKFDRRANTTTGAGGKVGKRVFGGQGCYVCSWCPMIVIWRVCLFNVHTRRLMHCTCCRKRIEKQRPKLRTRRTVNCRNIGRWPIYCWFCNDLSWGMKYAGQKDFQIMNRLKCRGFKNVLNVILTQCTATTGAGRKVGEGVSGGQGRTSFMISRFDCSLQRQNAQTHKHIHTHMFNVVTHASASVTG